MEVEYRFWSKVEITRHCWNWIASLHSNGYGQFYFEGTPRRAHRIAWELTNGPIPIGSLVCHHCDNKRCVRPDHLYLGNHRTNIQDAINRGQHHTAQGIEHPKAKLTPAAVRLIRKSSLTQRQLANQFGVNHKTICSVVNGRTWKSVIS